MPLDAGGVSGGSMGRATMFFIVVRALTSAAQPTHNTTRALTVVITTYNQPTCLSRMLFQLDTCDTVAEIRVNWFLAEDPPETQLGYRLADLHTPVIFDRWPDKLSYRFHPRNFMNDAVFSGTCACVPS